MIVEDKKSDVNAIKVGDRVRVKQSVVVYHHPEHKGTAFDLQGLEGEVDAIVTQWQGKPVSANLPILVKFSKKFKAHLRDNELEII
jgi:hypothetical protein